jgi:sulfite exporter TauE/SafE
VTGPEAVGRLFGVGLLWMGVHCAGMCGPLLLGLDVAGTRAGSSAVGGAARTLLYQLGKACSYAVLGAGAGLLGAGLEQVSTRAGAVLAVIFGVIALLHASGLRARAGSGTVQIGQKPTHTSHATPAQRAKRGEGTFRTTTTLLSLLRPLLVSRSPLRPFVLGLALAFLPCMISIWALGLAALTSSPAWGALVMVCLALATTPVLIVTSIVARGARWLSARMRARLQHLSAVVAGLWLLLIGLAGLDVVDHVHLPFALAGHSFVLMLF